MPWVFFDDQYPNGRAVAGLSDGAFRLHTTAFFWCQLNGTDGLIPLEDLDLVCPRLRAHERFAEECTTRGVWHDATVHCGSPNCLGVSDEPGWILHDFLARNPTAEEARARKAAKSDGGSLGNHRRWHTNRGTTDPNCDWCSDRSTDPPSDRSTDVGSESHANPSISIPSLSTADVSNPATGSSGLTLIDDSIIETIIKTIFELTSPARTVDRDWAAKIAVEILRGRRPRNPCAYVRQTLHNEPDLQRFLPTSLPAYTARRTS